MKKLLIISGKGGTGKTTVAAAFVSIGETRAYADCDVDAPNLHLVMKNLPEPENFDYYGMGKAKVADDLCIGCGECIRSCRFDALHLTEDGIAAVNGFACEGCGLCKELCPVDAISMQDDIAGLRMLYRIPNEVSSPSEKANQTNGDAVFSTAELRMGSGTSGKLVSEVKKSLFDNSDASVPMAIIDGSPGIGCPVIASITGVDMVLIVAEPSVSGISDMKRIIETALFFRVGITVCVNKADTNEERTREIITFCKENNFPFVGRIPYDKKVTEATNAGISVDQIDCPAGEAIRDVFRKVTACMDASD